MHILNDFMRKSTNFIYKIYVRLENFGLGLLLLTLNFLYHEDQKNQCQVNSQQREN